MSPETDPEAALIELRKQTLKVAEERATNLRRWWSAVARSHAALARTVHKPPSDSTPGPESKDPPST